jgi:hypothetical protein
VWFELSPFIQIVVVRRSIKPLWGKYGKKTPDLASDCPCRSIQTMKAKQAPQRAICHDSVRGVSFEFQQAKSILQKTRNHAIGSLIGRFGHPFQSPKLRSLPNVAPGNWLTVSAGTEVSMESIPRADDRRSSAKLCRKGNQSTTSRQ